MKKVTNIHIYTLFSIIFKLLSEIEEIFLKLYQFETPYENIFKLLKKIINDSLDSEMLGKENFKELISS